MSVDTTELRKLAEAATEVPDFSLGIALKRFRQKVYPSTVIALLDELEATKKEMHARELHHFESEELLTAAEGKITRALEAHTAKHGQRALSASTWGPTTWEKYVTCAACSADWPCATVRILTEGDPE